MDRNRSVTKESVRLRAKVCMLLLENHTSLSISLAMSLNLQSLSLVPILWLQQMYGIPHQSDFSCLCLGQILSLTLSISLINTLCPTCRSPWPLSPLGQLLISRLHRLLQHSLH